MKRTDQILIFLGEHPSSTVHGVAKGMDVPRSNVAAYLTRMFASHRISRSSRSPFTYSLPETAGINVLSTMRLLNFWLHVEVDT